jgi:hypothetical protein
MRDFIAQRLIGALDLPSSSRVDQRVPKKLLLENASPTAADKRQINDTIEEIQWVAALKPNTVGILDYRDDVREYLEIAVISVKQRTTNFNPTKVIRIHELMHRAVPYPVVLLLKSDPTVTLSLAHKRWAHNEAGKVVLDGGMVMVALTDVEASETILSEFIKSLSLSIQPKSTMFGLYQGWMDSVEALLAAKMTGTFKTANSPEQASARRQALQDCAQLTIEVARLQTQAAKEKQLARQVELNLTLKCVQARLNASRQQL